MLEKNVFKICAVSLSFEIILSLSTTLGVLIFAGTNFRELLFF